VSARPVAASLEKVEAILRNPALYELAGVIPEQDGGRPRTYPSFMFLAFGTLLSVWRSARQVEAELSHPLVWGLMREIVFELFPDEPQMQLPERPMRRHHYTYMRDRYLTDPRIRHVLGELHREGRDCPGEADRAARSAGPWLLHPSPSVQDASCRREGARPAVQGQGGGDAH
jgi:hypothetical protein